MPCYGRQNFPGGPPPEGKQAYRTEAACLEACKEGACCEGTSCSVKPQCQCQGAGQTFKGIGTTCSPNPCGCCADGSAMTGTVSVAITRTLDVVGGSFCACNVNESPPAQATRCRTQVTTFTQTGTASACGRFVIGDTLDGFQRGGSVNLTSQCQLNVSLDWAFNPCGGSLIRTYYSWAFSQSQATYEATYYNFFFVDGYGGSATVTTTSSTVPGPPTHPQASSGRSYIYGGAMWTVIMSVTFA